MYKSNDVQTKSTFHAELINEEKNESFSLSVYPPKMKILRKFSKINNEDDDSIDDVISCIAEFISRNKENIHLSADDIDDIFDVDDINNFLSDFFEWIKLNKKK